MSHFPIDFCMGLTTKQCSATVLPVTNPNPNLILRCSLFVAPTVHSVIGVSLSLEPGSGTVCRPLCAQQTCPLNGPNGHWRRFCLFETAPRLRLFCLRRAGYKFSDIHTYTYIHNSSVVVHNVYVCLCIIMRKTRSRSSVTFLGENIDDLTEDC